MAVAAMGLVVLVGWTLDAPHLTSIVPGWASMKVNTALGFVLAGASLVMAASPPRFARWHQLQVGLALVLLLLGALTLSQYLFSVDLGIDELLLKQRSGTDATAAPGRMALATALAFAFTGLGLALLHSGAAALLAVGSSLLGGLIGLLALLGYAYGVQALYAAIPFTSVAMHTACGLLLANIGFLLARPGRQPVRALISVTDAARLARRLLPWALIVPFLIGLARTLAERQGLIRGEFGVALVSITYVVLLSALIWSAAEALRRSELQRKAVQRAQLKQQSQLNGVIESAIDAMIVVNGSQRIVLFNPAAEDMFGRRSADMLGQTLEALLPQSAWAGHGGMIRNFGEQSMLKRRMGAARPVMGVRANGELFPIEASISKLDTDGERFYTAILRDVTLREQAEQARSAAELASRTKSSFLANMSHEIRTPMNAIIGLTHLLRRASPTPDQADRLDKIDMAGRHLLSIINDILDLSKIEAGRLQIEQTDFHLAAILDNVLSIISDQARVKGLRVELDPDSVPQWLRGDPTRLRQALLNYASNAVKFTAEGSIAVRAILLGEEGHELLVRFEVQDTGIGIEADKLPRLFTAFEQADSSTTREFGGTGLGLAITKRLAQLMGGDAGVSSTPGVGTTFWFTTRLLRGHGVMPVAPALADSSAETLLRQRHAGTRVLLAEDNPINREVALELLHAVALAVDTAANGREAVEMARANGHELILMDMQMPVMDGLDATREIRQLPGWATKPILALTANAFNEDREACLRAGMDDFVVKPVDPQELYRALVTWLPSHATAMGRAARPAGDGPPPVPVDWEARLRSVTGLDPTYGLTVLRGRPERYAELLRLFARQSEAEAATLQQCLALGDRVGAAATAHSLKGAAAAVGAVALRAVVEQLERALAEGREPQVLVSMAADVAEIQAELSAQVREHLPGI